MARKSNSLFIGADKLNIEGRAVKHPALIKMYGTINVNKVSDSYVDVIGVDLETDAETGELKLLGFYNEDNYDYYYNDDFVNVLFNYVKYCKHKQKALAYWSKLDPFVLYKQLLIDMGDSTKIELSMKKFNKVSGEWDHKEKEWTIEPITMTEIDQYVFGIKNVIRSSIQFYYYDKDNKNLKTVWAYDIKALYQNDLQSEALGEKDEKTGKYLNPKLPYYTKIDESAHIVDWQRFEKDKYYKDNIVLKSNMLDARAVRDLAIYIQEEFKTAFKFYPRTLISQGSFARSAIIASFINTHLDDRDIDGLNEQEQEKLFFNVAQDAKSIGIINYLDTWVDKYGADTIKDLYAKSMEAYSGGYIESVRYGFAKKAYYADLASAYPAIIVDLYDLRNSKITHGTGEPPHIKYSYCFIRGTVNIPKHVNYHSITIKHPIAKETNIRATGEYIASYTIEERDYLLTLGATFKDENWTNIETQGILSPLAKVARQFVNLRTQLIKEGNSAQHMAKISVNSIYGILYEAVDTYEEIGQEVDKAGYRAGEFFNPIYATMITALTRIKLAKASNHIESLGGKVVSLMTDAVFWTGSSDMLPKEMWKEVKTLGYFEKPEEIHDYLNLGSGRYEYFKADGHYFAKKRGLNAIDSYDIDLEQLLGDKRFSWRKALELSIKNTSDKMHVAVRGLVSVGVALMNGAYSFLDLGRVVTEIRDVDLVVGKNKRYYQDGIKDAKTLLTDLVDTEPINLDPVMFGKYEVLDQSLPELRELMNLKAYETAKDKRKVTQARANKKYYKTSKFKEQRNKSYETLRNVYNYSAKDARIMSNWSADNIYKKLSEDNKL